MHRTFATSATAVPSKAEPGGVVRQFQVGPGTREGARRGHIPVVVGFGEVLHERRDLWEHKRFALDSTGLFTHPSLLEHPTSSTL